MFIRVVYVKPRKRQHITELSPNRKENIKMKKILAIALAALMLVACVACGNKTETPVAENALEIMDKVWSSYTEEEMFPVAGGIGETSVMGGPATITLGSEENDATVKAFFVLNDDAFAMVDDVAHLMHMMNQNTFTAGCFHIADGNKPADFAASVKESVSNNNWMCGFSEKLVVIVIGDYVISAFGHGNAIDPFVEKVQAAYETASVVVEESLA